MQEIEEIAEAFLAAVPAYVWDGQTLPVPVEDIADSCAGLHVRDVEDLATAPGAPSIGPGETLSGLLLPAAGEIWVSADEARQWPPRRRFTIAHELGHWRMHRHRAGVFCRAAVVEPTPQPERAPLPAAEQEANAFAAALLMPARLIRERYEAGRDFNRLCVDFGASGAAMGRRLHAVVPRAKP